MTAQPLSARKQRILELGDALASQREEWIAKNAFFYAEDLRYLRLMVPPGESILELGCGTGHLLDALQPARGVGVDISPAMVETARELRPSHRFVVGDVEDPATYEQLDGPFDVVILSDLVGSLDDCEATFRALRKVCDEETRVVIAYFSHLWAPMLRFAEELGDHMPRVDQNWLSARDLASLLELADFEVVQLDQRQLLPKRAGGLGPLVNRYLSTLPGLRRLALRTYVVARVGRAAGPGLSATVVIPCRNEAGNIEPAIERMPPFCDDLEVIFVEGHSQDDTAAAIEKVIANHPETDIKMLTQDGVGKGDAVRKGFAEARGDVLMILDADLTVPPEDLPKFYEAIRSGKGELVMGTRLVYPMEREAMRFLNIIGNKLFSLAFTWLLNQRITDTLCGTKVLTKVNYQRIAENRDYFGDFDPFGDFDLIFGAARLQLKIVEIPVRYRARSYGTTQISRFRHGWLLIRMLRVAYRKLKAV